MIMKISFYVFVWNFNWRQVSNYSIARYLIMQWFKRVPQGGACQRFMRLLTVKGILGIFTWINCHNNYSAVGAKTWRAPSTNVVSNSLLRHSTFGIWHVTFEWWRSAECCCRRRNWRRRFGMRCSAFSHCRSCLLVYCSRLKSPINIKKNFSWWISNYIMWRLRIQDTRDT